LSPKKTTSSIAPVKASHLTANANTLTLSPFSLTIPETAPLEIYGEPQAGKTLYGLWLANQFLQQKKNQKNGLLVVRCEKFDSSFVLDLCKLYEIDPDVIDLRPPNAPQSLYDLFNIEYLYDVDAGSGRIDVALLETSPLEKIGESIVSNYGVVFIDTLTSVLNHISAAGLKNFPARNTYENILFTLIDIASYLGTTFILTGEHSKNVTMPFAPVELKGGKEVERRSDYIVLIKSNKEEGSKAFSLYAKRWPLMVEGALIGKMALKGKVFERVK